MRLIDVEEVHEIFNWSHQKPPYSKKTIHRYIDMAREVDAVPVIRCKDCKKFVTEEDQAYCLDMYGQCDENGFCAWAERKEE